MSNYVENLNDLIIAKNEIKSIIRDAGVEPGDVFSYYPAYIRSAIAGGGSIVDYPTYTYIATYYPDFTYLFSYVGDAIGGIDVDIDLSSYVTHTELDSAAYITAAYLVDNKYLHNDAQGRLVGDLAVNGMNVQVAGINYNLDINCNAYTHNVIPQESDTYTLGDTSNYYHTLYTNRIQGANSVNIRTGGNNRLTVTSTAFRPMQQNYNLGSSDYPFTTAYISNIYNLIWTGTSVEYAALSDYTTYQIYLIQEA